MVRHFLSMTLAAILLPAQAATVSTRGTLTHNLDGVVIAADGSAYVSSADGGSIIHVTEDGNHREVYRAANSYFVGVVQRGGDLYVTEYKRGQVLRIRNGQASVIASGIVGAGDIIAERRDEGFIVAATRGGQVYRLDDKGTRSELASNLPGVLGLAQDEAGTIYAASLIDGSVYRLEATGPKRLAMLAIAGDYKIGHLEYAHGHLYATGIGDHRIYRIDKEGHVEVFAGAAEAGSADGPADAARFNAPNGIAADPRRRQLLISEYGGRRLRTLDLAADGRDAAVEVTRLADAYVAAYLGRYPENAVFAGVSSTDSEHLFDNSLRALASWQQQEDAWLNALAKIDVASLRDRPEWITQGFLREALESSKALRACRGEYWPVSQLEGWQLTIAGLATMQPVETAEQRERLLRQWHQWPRYLATEMANLDAGLKAGYSTPKPSVERALSRLDGLLAAPAEHSPLDSPAQRGKDEAFAREWRSLVAKTLLPAMQRYRDYLQQEYLVRARDELSVLAHPEGEACYAASLRRFTGLTTSGATIFAAGNRAVADYTRQAKQLARALYGTDDLGQLRERMAADPTSPPRQSHPDTDRHGRRPGPASTSLEPTADHRLPVGAALGLQPRVRSGTDRPHVGDAGTVDDVLRRRARDPGAAATSRTGPGQPLRRARISSAGARQRRDHVADAARKDRGLDRLGKREVGTPAHFPIHPAQPNHTHLSRARPLRPTTPIAYF